jgi:hypothetical protein
VCWNAPASIRANSDSVSNEIDTSEEQSEKHFEQRIRTRRGIVSDLRKEQYENASDSMSVNSQSVSNEIDKSEWHP